MFSRHSLVWLNAAGWQAALAGASAADRCAVKQWRDANWPTVARRTEVDAGAGLAFLGLALPPAAAGAPKRRIALAVPEAGLGNVLPALALEATLAWAPAPWRAPLRHLHEEAERQGIALRVFGSLAWQTLTGQPYLTPVSDIDLLFSPANENQIDIGLELLCKYGAALPLDGEILFRPDEAVAWKEFHYARIAAKPQRVLAKSRHGVHLRTVTELTATLE